MNPPIFLTMENKKSVFDKLRPLLLSTVVAILSLFIVVEAILIAFLIYIWYADPANNSSNHIEEGIIALIILTLLTYVMKVRFSKLVEKK